MINDLDNEKVYKAIENGVYKAVFDFLNKFCSVDSEIEAGVKRAFTEHMNCYIHCVPKSIESGVYQAMKERDDWKWWLNMEMVIKGQMATYK